MCTTQCQRRNDATTQRRNDATTQPCKAVAMQQPTESFSDVGDEAPTVLDGDARHSTSELILTRFPERAPVSCEYMPARTQYPSVQLRRETRVSDGSASVRVERWSTSWKIWSLAVNRLVSITLWPKAERVVSGLSFYSHQQHASMRILSRQSTGWPQRCPALQRVEGK